TKRATRQFREEPIPDDVVRAILDSGRRAQSSKNTQPWQFVVVRERETLRQLADSGPFAKHLANAALGVALVSPNPSERWSIPFDLGQCAAYMQLAAWELGVGSVIGAIYDEQKAKAILGIPAEQHFVVALSFGYPAEDVQRTPLRRGGRKPLDEITHWEHW
ncbi:MAG: nitroreductase family protein, partial [Chloroflexi bacterium]|nr:nitroreductase family protein [Chloroflexota bacterium]